MAASDLSYGEESPTHQLDSFALPQLSQTKAPHGVDAISDAGSTDGQWRCNACAISFLRREHLIRHNRRHENSHCQACPLCERTLHRSDHLRYHLMQHFDVRPYECTDCNKRYRQAYSLARHQQKSGHCGTHEHHFDVDEMVAQRLASDTETVRSIKSVKITSDETTKQPTMKQAKRTPSSSGCTQEPSVKRSKPESAAVSPASSPLAFQATPACSSEPVTLPTANPLQMAIAMQQMLALRQMQMLSMMQASASMMSNPLLLAAGQTSMAQSWPTISLAEDKSDDN
eukprot:m.87579 g.87579  ORF g.87579 m.87579 type:complete len:286 (-) comp14784_c0_seq3:61-918(-)